MESESEKSRIFERLNSGRRRGFGLRMAPMIDMIFLLLIFFLVAANWRPAEDFLSLQLPSARAGQVKPGRPEPLVIFIDTADAGCAVRIGEGGEIIVIDNQSMEQGLVELMEKMQETMVLQRRIDSDPIEIVCAAEVTSDCWVRVYNVLTGLQLTDVTFQMTE